METLAKKSGKGTTVGSLVLIAFFVGIIVWGISAIFSSEPSTPSPVQENKELGDFEAYYEAQTIIKKALKSPSTAEFPSSGEARIQRLADSSFKVSSYVDSQNGFGAMIRTEWTVVFRVTEDKMIDVYQIVTDGQEVYRKAGM